MSAKASVVGARALLTLGGFAIVAASIWLKPAIHPTLDLGFILLPGLAASLSLFALFTIFPSFTAPSKQKAANVLVAALVHCALVFAFVSLMTAKPNPVVASAQPVIVISVWRHWDRIAEAFFAEVVLLSGAAAFAKSALAE